MSDLQNPISREQRIGGIPPGTGAPPSGGGQFDDQQKLLQILRTIRNTLHTVVFMRPTLFPSDLGGLFRETWGEVDQTIQTAIAIVGDQKQFGDLYRDFERAGLTGNMLALKSTALGRYADRFQEVTGDSITYPRRASWKRIFVKAARPLFACMNSILGSLKVVSSVFAVLEIAKEYKEHVEIAVDLHQ